MRAINADLWWLLPLALVPVLIHLLIRRRPPTVRWAAMTFLLQALRRNRRKLLLETILLLIVRTALVFVLVVTVVRPVVRAGWAFLASERQPTVSVIVVDDSAGMAASDGVRTRYAHALARIGQYLDALPGGSRTAVVLAARPPTALVSHPTRDLQYVRDALSKREPRDGPAALADAIEQARALLANESSPNREIIVVTDGRTAAWQRDRDRIDTALASAATNAGVYVLAVPPTPPENVSVSGLSIGGGADVPIPSLATTLWPTTIDVRIAAQHHDEPVDTVVELFVNDRKVARQPVQVPSNRQAVVSFTHSFTAPGSYAVSARCTADRFERDNQSDRVVGVRDRIAVLMIDGRPATKPFDSATGFLHVALWPPDPDHPDASSPFDVQIVSAGGIESVLLPEYAVIVVADVAALPRHAIARIEEAVRHGAGLLIVAGGQVTGENLTAMFGDAGSGLLSVEPAPAIDVPPDDEPIGLTLASPLPSALVAFEAPTLAEPLARVGWRTLRPIAAIHGDDAQTWARFARGGAAVVADRHGRGHVVYVGAPMDRSGGEFPLSPAFVPFVQQIVAYLASGNEPPPGDAGAPLEWPIAPPGAEIVYPDGTREPADRFVVDDVRTGEPHVVLPSADRAGVYVLEATGRAGVAVRTRRAVNVPDGESDLAVEEAAALRPAIAAASARFVAADDALAPALRAGRTGAELWTGGLLLLLVLWAIEMLLVRWFAPRQVDSDAVLRRAMQL